MLNRRLVDGIPFQWHHHPEYEITLTLNSRGLRFVGDNVGEYDDEDLVLLGSNLPHTWASRGAIRDGEPHVALVLWFDPSWANTLTRDFDEFRDLNDLLSRSRRGVHFSPAVAAAVRDQYELLFKTPPVDRFLGLLALLSRLAREENCVPLASEVLRPTPPLENRDRIDRVLSHIHAHYAHPVSLSTLADVAALSESGLHRMFQKHVRMNVSDYIARVRIGDACARLAGSEQPIALIAEAVGYGTLANFNRQFKRFASLTPREYRAHFRRRPR